MKESRPDRGRVLELIRSNITMAATVKCAECGAVEEVTLTWPYRADPPGHTEPRVFARAMSCEDGSEVREGLDVPSTLCGACFARAAKTVAARRAEVLKARRDAARADLERQRVELAAEIAAKTKRLADLEAKS